MVCCTAWSEETKPNLFTCGFDRVTFGWAIQPREVKDMKQKSDQSQLIKDYKELKQSLGKEMSMSTNKEAK